jgi:hypothetical protein
MSTPSEHYQWTTVVDTGFTGHTIVPGRQLDSGGQTVSEDRGYGFCPHCGAPGSLRERRPNGNDHCENGHTYPSNDAKWQRS